MPRLFACEVADIGHFAINCADRGRKLYKKTLPSMYFFGQK